MTLASYLLLWNKLRQNIHTYIYSSKYNGGSIDIVCSPGYSLSHNVIYHLCRLQEKKITCVPSTMLDGASKLLLQHILVNVCVFIFQLNLPVSFFIITFNKSQCPAHRVDCFCYMESWGRLNLLKGRYFNIDICLKINT